MPRHLHIIALGAVATAGLLGVSSLFPHVDAQAQNSWLAKADVHKTIGSFSVGPDQALTYPPDLFALPDMHTTFMPRRESKSYLVFASAARVSAGGGTIVLETSDLKNFTYPAGYSSPVMGPPLGPTCNPAYDSEFDENYAGPGSVVRDPTRPPGQLIMIYHAENHCPGGVHQAQFYATVAFARSRDEGKTWPAPVPTEFGDRNRRPVLKLPVPEPTTSFTIFMGDAGPSAFVHRTEDGDYHLYVTYQYFYPGPGNNGLLRVARAKLGDDDDRVTFRKWYNGHFSEPGIGGLDSGVLPGAGCIGFQAQGQISYSDELGLFLMTYLCVTQTQAGWYYSTATSLDRQDWTAPLPIENSQFPLVKGCGVNGTVDSFDGYYPSFMSPDHAPGHLGKTGLVFFMNGCIVSAVRKFQSRTFTITTN